MQYSFTMTHGEFSPEPEIEIEDMLEQIADSEFRLQYDLTSELLLQTEHDFENEAMNELRDAFGEFYLGREVRFVGVGYRSKRMDGPYEEVFTEVSDGCIMGLIPVEIDGKKQPMLRILEDSGELKNWRYYHIKPVIDNIVSMEVVIDDIDEESYEVDTYHMLQDIAARSKATINAPEFKALCLGDQLDFLDQILQEVEDQLECFKDIAPQIAVTTSSYTVAYDAFVDTYLDRSEAHVRAVDQSRNDAHLWHTPSGSEVHAVFPDLAHEEFDRPLTADDFEICQGVPHISLTNGNTQTVYWVPIDKIQGIGFSYEETR